MNVKFVISFLLFLQISAAARKRTKKCDVSATVVSGTHAPEDICSGNLIFEDNFDKLDFKKWKHENTLSGGGNWEFQWYTNNRTNSYVKDGILYLKPTLTADAIGEENLTKMTLDLNGGSPQDYCTDRRFYGCTRTGTSENILNPIKSAKLTTVESFSFKFGRVEVRAKLPTGDWLWPAIWLLPRYNVYSTWPSSGEIDLMESRGNEKLTNSNQVNIGVEQVGSTLHWGPNPNYNSYQKTNFLKNAPSQQGFNKNFSTYELIWNPESISFKINGEHIGTVQPNSTFWELGEFTNSGLENPWKYGTKFAPFDEEFYVIFNLAAGGVGGYWPDNADNPSPKPWKNDSPRAMADFWNARNDWYPTWNGENASLQIDYIKIWAL